MVLSSIRTIIASIVIVGLLCIAVGVLVIAYPDLLGILVGVLLVISGIIWLVLAAKLFKYSKLKIEL